MPAGFTVTVTGTEDLTRRLLALGQDAPKAATRAVNRTLSTLRTATGRALARESGLTVTRTRRSVKIQRATWTRQIGHLVVSGRRIPLIAFGARQTRRGVSYRGPGRTVLPSSFLARMKSGHRGVFLRAGRARLPIREQFGPSLPETFIQRHIREAMLARANDLIVQNLEHEIAFILSQRAPAGDGVTEAA